MATMVEQRQVAGGQRGVPAGARPAAAVLTEVGELLAVRRQVASEQLGAAADATSQEPGAVALAARGAAAVMARPVSVAVQPVTGVAGASAVLAAAASDIQGDIARGCLASQAGSATRRRQRELSALQQDQPAQPSDDLVPRLAFGMQNEDRTSCFIIAMLQCLFSSPQFCRSLYVVDELANLQELARQQPLVMARIRAVSNWERAVELVAAVVDLFRRYGSASTGDVLDPGPVVAALRGYANGRAKGVGIDSGQESLELAFFEFMNAFSAVLEAAHPQLGSGGALQDVDESASHCPLAVFRVLHRICRQCGSPHVGDGLPLLEHPVFSISTHSRIIAAEEGGLQRVVRSALGVGLGSHGAQGTLLERRFCGSCGSKDSIFESSAVASIPGDLLIQVNRAVLPSIDPGALAVGPIDARRYDLTSISIPSQCTFPVRADQGHDQLWGNFGLVAVCEFYPAGPSVNAGHYKVSARRGDGKWFLFNDIVVSPLAFSPRSSSHAVFLLYRCLATGPRRSMPSSPALRALSVSR